MDIRASTRNRTNDSAGLAQHHKKVKTPNSTRCVHLSISGTSTLGISALGVKQAIKMSKVHSTARNLARFV